MDKKFLRHDKAVALDWTFWWWGDGGISMPSIAFSPLSSCWWRAEDWRVCEILFIVAQCLDSGRTISHWIPPHKAMANWTNLHSREGSTSTAGDLIYGYKAAQPSQRTHRCTCTHAMRMQQVDEGFSQEDGW